MLGNFFRSHKQNCRERPSFRPVLETLEGREVPSVADLNAAFNALPTDVGNLEAALAAHNAAAVNTNLAAVTNDVITLQLGAAAFNVPSRLQIDNAFVVDGLNLFVAGFNYMAFNKPQFVQVVRLGVEMIELGIKDSLVVGFFPNATDDNVLA